MTIKGNGAVAMVLAAACWGIGTVISKAVLTHVEPLLLLLIQLAVSVTFLWGLVAVKRTPLRLQREMLSLGLAGWLNPGLAYTFGLLGLAMTTASMSSLIWAAEPALILVLAWLFLRDRPSFSVIGWSGVAILGATIVVGSSLASEGEGAMAGNALVSAGVLCCATYTVLTRRTVERVNPLLLVAVQQTISLVWALFVWWVAGQQGTTVSAPILTPTVWFWAAISGLIYYALAFVAYIIGLRQMPASLAGQYLNLIPIFGVTAAFLVLDEQLTIWQWLGAALILVAVFVISHLYHRIEANTSALLSPVEADG